MSQINNSNVIDKKVMKHILFLSLSLLLIASCTKDSSEELEYNQTSIEYRSDCPDGQYGAFDMDEIMDIVSNIGNCDYPFECPEANFCSEFVESCQVFGENTSCITELQILNWLNELNDTNDGGCGNALGCWRSPRVELDLNQYKLGNFVLCLEANLWYCDDNGLTADECTMFLSNITVGHTFTDDIPAEHVFTLNNPFSYSLTFIVDGVEITVPPLGQTTHTAPTSFNDVIVSVLNEDILCRFDSYSSPCHTFMSSFEHSAAGIPTVHTFFLSNPFSYSIQLTINDTIVHLMPGEEMLYTTEPLGYSFDVYLTSDNINCFIGTFSPLG